MVIIVYTNKNYYLLQFTIHSIQTIYNVIVCLFVKLGNYW